MAFRLLRLGPSASWLPEWKQGRLLIGSSPTADAQVPGRLFPFHCLVELTRGAPLALVHDLARQGDVTDAAGRPAPAEGLAIRAGERFRVAGNTLALVHEATQTETLADGAGPVCLVCRTNVPPDAAHRGRTIGAELVCPGCLGVVDLDATWFPRHEVLAWLGAGGMGAVYLALERATERLVAIKLIRVGAANARAFERFQREIRVLGRLDHASILKIFEAGTAPPDAAFLVCELVRGGDAYARLSRAGVFPPGDVARIGAQLADALDYAHGLGIIHRDVKPGNVLLELDGRPKLSDFGLAKELERAGGPSTASGVGFGTFGYAAPEQIRDARRAGEPADVFALGATLFHLATGRPPRDAPTLDALRGKLDVPPPSATSVNARVPISLARALESALAPRARDRPTAAELRDRLLAIGREVTE